MFFKILYFCAAVRAASPYQYYSNCSTGTNDSVVVKLVIHLIGYAVSAMVCSPHVRCLSVSETQI